MPPFYLAVRCQVLLLLLVNGPHFGEQVPRWCDGDAPPPCACEPRVGFPLRNINPVPKLPPMPPRCVVHLNTQILEGRAGESPQCDILLPLLCQYLPHTHIYTHTYIHTHTHTQLFWRFLGHLWGAADSTHLRIQTCLLALPPHLPLCVILVKPLRTACIPLTGPYWDVSAVQKPTCHLAPRYAYFSGMSGDTKVWLRVLINSPPGFWWEVTDEQ